MEDVGEGHLEACFDAHFRYFALLRSREREREIAGLCVLKMSGKLRHVGKWVCFSGCFGSLERKAVVECCDR